MVCGYSTALVSDVSENIAQLAHVLQLSLIELMSFIFTCLCTGALLLLSLKYYICDYITQSADKGGGKNVLFEKNRISFTVFVPIHTQIQQKHVYMHTHTHLMVSRCHQLTCQLLLVKAFLDSGDTRLKGRYLFPEGSSSKRSWLGWEESVKMFFQL